MEHLDPLVRAKAIEIANALLDERHDEGLAIRVAISRAKEWRSGADCRNVGPISPSLPQAANTGISLGFLT
jgi:uncharacterized protein YdaT